MRKYSFSFQLQHDNGRVTLFIAEANPTNAGSYVLCAKNSVGLAFASCNISINNQLPSEIKPVKMVAVESEPIKPTVQLPLRDICANIGKCIQLDCVITGQPEPEVIWYHEKRPVKESADVQLLFQGDRCSLVIQEIVPEDVGEYKVVAINSAGEASSTCRLSLAPIIETSIAPNQNGASVNIDATAPRFEKLLSDILADEGSTITFESIVSGKPTPTIKWLQNNIEIGQSDRIQFVNDSESGRVALILKNVTGDDKGVYTVKATNEAGDAKCFSQLIVKSVNGAENGFTQNHIEEKHICPTFRERFGDKVASVDDTVKFECIIVGKPTPKVKWLYNDQPVQGKNFLTSTSGDRQVLTVPAVTHDALGKIMCTAENDFGKAACIAYLTLAGDKAPPSCEEVKRYVEEYNTESSNVTIRRQQTTTTKTSQISSFQTENGVIPSGNQQSVNLMKRSIELGSDATNVPHAIEPSMEIVLRTARKNSAPRFISPLIGKILDQGGTAVMEATFDGFPAPEIVILKNGEPLKEQHNITVTQLHNKVRIELRDVAGTDAGRYSCSITNSIGNAISTADIVVKSKCAEHVCRLNFSFTHFFIIFAESVFPPVFGHRLQAQVAKRGERVLMDCEVSGVPDPTVTWLKNGQPLNPNEYQVKKSGNNYTLIVENGK